MVFLIFIAFQLSPLQCITGNLKFHVCRRGYPHGQAQGTAPTIQRRHVDASVYSRGEGGGVVGGGPLWSPVSISLPAWREMFHVVSIFLTAFSHFLPCIRLFHAEIQKDTLICISQPIYTGASKILCVDCRGVMNYARLVRILYRSSS